MKLFSIETGNFYIDGGAMFGVVPKVIWQKIYPADEKNQCNLAIRSMLIDCGEQKILIDTGIGNKQSEKFFRHYYRNGKASLISSLAEVGYKPEDITDVIHTHLHFDHCGGSVVYDKDNKLVTAFPNATYHISKLQWETATKPNAREKASFLLENFMPIQEYRQLSLVENEGELFPGVELRFFHGHTAGQIVPIVHTPKQTVVFGADLLPLSAHIKLPYVMAYDMHPLKTLEEKAKMLKEIHANNYVLFLQHDIATECCTLTDSEKGLVLDKKLTIKDI